MKKTTRIFCLLLAFIAVAAASFTLGWFISPKTTNDPLYIKIDHHGNGVTFFAIVEEARDGYLLVDGLEENDINHRGQFHCHIDEDTQFLRGDTAITLDNIQKGDLVAVTYTGIVLEIYPGVIQEVLCIEILK